MGVGEGDPVVCECGHENSSDARFCNQCGRPLRTAAPISGEWRQLTCVFCDLEGYSRFSELVDKELLGELVSAYHDQVDAIFRRWGGTVCSHDADGVFAYFGYPVAHEDHAERAIRASLQILEAHVSARATRHEPTGLLAELPPRIGVHTDRVVLKHLTNPPNPYATAVNITKRLQGVAAAGTAVISDATERLVTGRFAVADLGLQALKGITTSVRAYTIATSRSAGADLAHTPATPFVGRLDDLAVLSRLWEAARRGTGRAIDIVGDAGIGKSRLVRTFVRDVTARTTVRTIQLRCSWFHSNTPLNPVIEGLEHELAIEHRRSSPAEIAKLVEQFLAASIHSDDAPALEGAPALIGELLSTALDSSTSGPETPPVRRARTLKTLCDLVAALARTFPTVLVIEDVHWADASTLELVQELVARVAGLPLLLLLTHRDEFKPSWGSSPNVETLSLTALSSADCADLVDRMAGGRPLSAETREALLADAEGVPLFIEELTRAALEGREVRPTASSSNTKLLALLQALLTSRLDALPVESHATVRLAAALTRRFQFEVLAAVSTKPENELRRDLENIVRTGLIYPIRRARGEAYEFKHALLADVAEHSLLTADRRRLHAQIAERLAAAFPALGIEQPEVLARHHEEAGNITPAVEYRRRAGEIALAKGAYAEALHHFEYGLSTLVPEVESEHDRLRHEIDFTEAKGRALFSTQGYAAKTVEDTFAHAMALCERDGSSPTYWALFGMWAVNITRSNREATEKLLPRFVERARSGDPVEVMTARANTGAYAFMRGDFERSAVEMQAAIDLYSTSEHAEFVKRHAWAGGVYTFAYRVWALTILGRFDEAAAVEDELQHVADAAANPYGIAIAGGFRINAARDRGDAQATLAMAQQQIEFANRQLLRLWEGPARCCAGWARAVLGDVSGGVEEARLGLKFLEYVGLQATYACHLTCLVEALLLSGTAGHLDEAASLVEQGLRLCETDLACFYRAELVRLRAECARRRHDNEGVEAGFREALAQARTQSARLLAARALDSLCRLLVAQDRCEQARTELEHVLAGLGDGISTGDAQKLRQMIAAVA
jgi:class 3 adenylate cyclase